MNRLARLLAGVCVAGVVVAATVWLAGALGAFRGTPPTDLGVRDGRLKAPSASPNSVSSQADWHPDHPQRSYARIDPLMMRGEPMQAMRALAAELQGLPRWRIVQQEGVYLRAEAHTRWLHFTDDVEFFVQKASETGWSVVHVRSASRLGQRDLGANRERIEQLRRIIRAKENPGAADMADKPLTGY